MRDRQQISFIASSLKDRDDGLLPCDASPTGSVLPAALVYGANASGKTNLFLAIRDMREWVLGSHRKGEPGTGVPSRRPFALDSDIACNPTSFDIDFVLEGIRYHYGFEATDDAFVSEWLYSFPMRYRRVLFEREGENFEFGRTLGGANKLISTLVRPNSLFVSAGAQNDHPVLSSIYGYFKSMRGIGGTSISSDDASSNLAKSEPDERVIDFLREMGTGVVDFRLKKRQISDQDLAFRLELEALVKRVFDNSHIVSGDGDERLDSVEFAHAGLDGKPVFFELSSESAGTRRLLVLLAKVYRSLDQGTPVCIDELDASLHTHAAEAVLNLFCSPATNPNGAQLIATTHDTNLLSSPILRRDQVWLAEKSRHGATELFPLTDIKTRKADNLERGYLQGRYGGVPPANQAIHRGIQVQV